MRGALVKSESTADPSNYIFHVLRSQKLLYINARSTADSPLYTLV